EESVIERQAVLEAEIEREIAFTAEAPTEQRFTLSAYLTRCEGYREQLRDLLQKIRNRIAHAQEDLAEAFRQLKPVEETQKRRDEAAQMEENRLEQIDLDEIGLNLHRRREQRIL
ncbi:MAG: flagellar FliJ family protein, partial [Rhodospirillaceae bacterium]